MNAIRALGIAKFFNPFCHRRRIPVTRGIDTLPMLERNDFSFEATFTMVVGAEAVFRVPNCKEHNILATVRKPFLDWDR